MKKFTKAVLIGGGALFLIGLLLALTGLALGGDPYVVQQRLNQMGVVHIGRNYEYSYHWDYSDDSTDDGGAGRLTLPAPDEPDIPAAPAAPLTASEYEIKRLDFTFDVGDIHIITGDDFELIYGNDSTRRYFYEKKSGDTWIIGSSNVRWSWFRPWNFRGDEVKLTVVLPRDFVAERAVISMGAGNMQAQRLSARELLLDVGVGNCQLGALAATEAQLSVGVGYLEIQNFQAGQASLDVGLGSMELKLAQPLDQYRCHLQVGLGSVSLGGNTYSGVAELDTGPADAPYSFDINCGLGSISVRPPITVQI